MQPVGIPNTKLRNKFEVSSSNIFEDMLDRLPEVYRSRDLCHAPFGEIIYAPSRQLGI